MRARENNTHCIILVYAYLSRKHIHPRGVSSSKNKPIRQYTTGIDTGNVRPTMWAKRICILRNKACVKKTPALISYSINKEYDVFSSWGGRKKLQALFHILPTCVVAQLTIFDLQRAQTYCTLQCSFWFDAQVLQNDLKPAGSAHLKHWLLRFWTLMLALFLL